MLPSMAALRSSSIFFSRGRATLQKMKRMMMKHTDDHTMSYHAGRSGLGASSVSAASVTRAFSILSPYVEVVGSVAEDEGGGDADEGERLGECDTDPHEDLQATGELGLAGDTFDGLAHDDAHADGRADRCEAVADGRDAAGDLGENRSCVHGFFPFGCGRRKPTRLVLFRYRELDVDRGEEG